MRKRYEVDIVFDEGAVQKLINFLQNKVKPSKVRIPLEWQAIATDYNRDGKIDTADMADARNEKIHYFWINDNDDRDDVTGNSIPESGKDWLKPNISGTRDLVDYFPVHLDIAELLKVLPPANYIYRLKQEDSAIAFAETELTAENSKQYLTDVAKAKEIGGEGVLSSTPGKKTYPVVRSGTNINIYQLQWIQLNKGLLLAEGRFKTNKPLVLEVLQKNSSDVAFRTQMALSIDGIEQMFRHKNLIAAGGGTIQPSIYYTGTEDRLDEPTNYPDSETNGKNFVFVHGHRVQSNDARGWHAEMFKRLYWSGSRAKFWGVTWNVNMIDYYGSAINAFKTAPALSGFLNQYMTSDVSIAGHSLGNMLISSTLSDYTITAPVRNYFLINAAVATEAYDGSAQQSTDMNNVAWDNYKQDIWTSEWYKLFLNDQPTDYRSKLTWRNRFATRPATVNYYNFYSSGEDVLESHPYNETPSLASIWTIISEGGRQSWALQEKFKGQFVVPYMMGSTYGGWSFNLDDYRESVSYPDPKPLNFLLANQIDPVQFRSKPFFAKGNNSGLFSEISGSSYVMSPDVRNRILVEAIPARTLAAGKAPVKVFGAENDNNFDMQSKYQNGWPLQLRDRNWRHNDFINIAFPYVFSLYNSFLNIGGGR